MAVAVAGLVLAGCGDGGAVIGASPTTVQAATTAPSEGSTTSFATTLPSTTASTTTASTATTTPSTVATTAGAVTTTTAPARPVPTTTAPAAAVIRSFAGPEAVECLTGGGTSSITVRWKVTGASSVTVGIESPDPFESGLPSEGSLDVPFAGCGDGATKRYFLTATGADRKTATSSFDAVPSFTPAVGSFTAPPSVSCPTSTIRLVWKVSNASSVGVAIENPSGLFETNLPLIGSLDVPFAGCSDGQAKTYHLVAQGRPGTPPVVVSRVVTGS
jgi:hypothetical protein